MKESENAATVEGECRAWVQDEKFKQNASCGRVHRHNIKMRYKQQIKSVYCKCTSRMLLSHCGIQIVSTMSMHAFATALSLKVEEIVCASTQTDH